MPIHFDYMPISRLPSALPRREMTMVLHTLLVHGGLETGLLPQLLPLSTNEVMQAVTTALDPQRVVEAMADGEIDL